MLYVSYTLASSPWIALLIFLFYLGHLCLPDIIAYDKKISEAFSYPFLQAIKTSGRK